MSEDLSASEETMMEAGIGKVDPASPAERWAVRASDIRPSTLPLIWRGRLPIGALSLIAGQAGLGKSSLGAAIATDLSQQSLGVVISNLEDDPAAVTRPRLDVAGAELDRVHIIPQAHAPVFPRDFEHLPDLVKQTEATLLIFDPIAAHFSPERRVHDRPTLRQLAHIARTTRCAILGIHHTVKQSVDGTALGAIGGPSGGLAGTSRAVYVYGSDPSDEDRRALACAKINGVEKPSTLIVEHDVAEYSAGELDIEAGLLRFVDETDDPAHAVLHRGDRRAQRDAECAEWLTTFLAAGDDCARQTKEVKKAGAKLGFPWATISRARLNLKVERQRIGFGGAGFWLWRLPDNHPLREDGADS